MPLPPVPNYVSWGEESRKAQLQGAQQANYLTNAAVDAQRIQAAQQAAQREQQFRSGLRPDMSQEQLAAHASQFVGPSDLLKVQQSSLDRQEQAKQRLTAHLDSLGVKQAEIERRKDEFLAKQQDANSRAKFDQWYKGQMVDIAKARAETANELQRLGIDLQRQNLELRKDMAANRPMTEMQGKASLYGTRAAQADKILTSLEDKVSPSMLAVARAVPGGNVMMTSEQRRIDQAQRNFVNAVLRQESGAAIAQSEFDNAIKQYFPSPNDDPKTIEQKRQNRKLAIQGFKRMAGPRGEDDIKAIETAPIMPGAPAGAAASKAPEGVPPELWNAMTPQEKALWQK